MSKSFDWDELILYVRKGLTLSTQSPVLSGSLRIPKFRISLACILKACMQLPKLAKHNKLHDNLSEQLTRTLQCLFRMNKDKQLCCCLKLKTYTFDEAMYPAVTHDGRLVDMFRLVAPTSNFIQT